MKMSVCLTLIVTVGAILLLPVCTQRVWAKQLKVSSDKEGLRQDVFVVHQSSLALGKTDLYLSENAGRLEAPKLALIIASRAPSWNIVIYSTRKNQGYVISGAEAKRDSLHMFSCSLATDQGKPRPIHDAQLRLDCLNIVMQTKNDQLTTGDTIIFQDRTKKVVRQAILKIATPCKIQPALQTFINFLFDLDKYPGLPLALETQYKDGSSVTDLYTSSIEHTSKSPSFFAYPTGFKKASNKLEVMLSEDMNDTLEDLWGSVPKKEK
ncbi:hypothetical protein BH10CYA1_BH10CYA1_47020 [soil metagenome]